MTAEQAAFCVKHPNHQAAKDLMRRDWDFMMLDPINRAAFDEAVQRFSDAVDDECLEQIYREHYGESQ